MGNAEAQGRAEECVVPTHWRKIPDFVEHVSQGQLSQGRAEECDIPTFHKDTLRNVSSQRTGERDQMQELDLTRKATDLVRPRPNVSWRAVRTREANDFVLPRPNVSWRARDRRPRQRLPSEEVLPWQKVSLPSGD